jgi:hypothetical protein
MLAGPDGNGHLLVGTDGEIFTFGDAGYFGSMGGKRFNAPIVAVSAA